MTNNLHNELSIARICTSSYKNQWKAYVEEAENQYYEGATSVEIARGGLEEGFQQW